MNDPPHIHRPVLQTLLVAGETVNVLGHQQGLVGCCRLSHGFYGENQNRFCVDSD